jgi:AraC-like DNA-binding protein
VLVLVHLSRSATLDGFAQVAGTFGLDPQALVAEVGLPGDCLTDPDLRIPTTAVLQAINLAAERAGIDNFGLHMARTRRYSNLGAVGLIMREQPTVRRALDALCANIWAQTEGLSVAVEEADEMAIVRVSLLHPGVISVRQNVEITLAVLVDILHRFLGQGWVPEMVMFSHGKPANLSLHIAIFGCVPMFGQELDAIVLRAADLDVAIPESDERIAAQLTRYLEFVAGRRTTDFAEKVQHMIGMMLPGGGAQADQVARHLGMDRRTLHRRLVRQGTSFSDLVQRERTQLAQGYIDAGDRSLTEIADLLGFSCLSAFSRWKKQALARPQAEGRDAALTAQGLTTVQPSPGSRRAIAPAARAPSSSRSR